MKYFYTSLVVAAILILGIRAQAQSLFMVTLESPPAEFSFNQTVVGRNVDIAKEGLKRMGFEVKVKILPWKQALGMAKTGAADAILDVGYTRDRATYLIYPDEAIYTEKWYLFRRAGEKITIDRNLGNLKRFTLGVCLGFEHGGVIQDAIDLSRFKGIHEVPDYETNVKNLMDDRYDLLLGVQLTTVHIAGKMGFVDAIEMVPMTETGRPYLLSTPQTYLAFSRKTMTKETADRFSAVFRQMKADGTLARIEAKYLPGPKDSRD